MSNGYKAGLEGVIAAETQLSHIDGQKGELLIGGYTLQEVAADARFEEMVYLLWHGRLPTNAQLDRFSGELRRQGQLPPPTLQLLRQAATRQVAVMDAVRMATATLDLDQLPFEQQPARILATLPTIVAAYWQLLNGAEPIAPDAELDLSANYLYMLDGNRPDAARRRALETYFNTVIDHGLNASTFTARVIISTHSDYISAITGAIGALKGPLHGGAPGPALDMVFEIGSAEQAEPYLRRKLEQDERLMGFGHRVYKVLDPRAVVLAEAAERLYNASGDLALYDLARHVEQVAVTLLAEYKPGRNLQTNVEYYTALLLHGIGLDSRLFTPTFAIARAGGWLAHCLEQLSQGRIMRPASTFVGRRRQWQPQAARA